MGSIEIKEVKLTKTERLDQMEDVPRRFTAYRISLEILFSNGSSRTLPMFNAVYWQVGGTGFFQDLEGRSSYQQILSDLLEFGLDEADSRALILTIEEAIARQMGDPS